MLSAFAPFFGRGGPVRALLRLALGARFPVLRAKIQRISRVDSNVRHCAYQGREVSSGIADAEENAAI